MHNFILCYPVSATGSWCYNFTYRYHFLKINTFLFHLVFGVLLVVVLLSVSGCNIDPIGVLLFLYLWFNEITSSILL